VALAFAIALGSLVAAVALNAAFGWSIVAPATIIASIALVAVRWRMPRRSSGAAIGLALSLGPALALCSAWTLAEPLATRGRHCFSSDGGVPFAVVLTVFAGAAIALPVTLAARFMDRGALLLASLFVVTGSVFTAAGVWSLSRPAPDDYLRLFRRSTIPLPDKVDIGTASIAYTAGPHELCTVDVGGNEYLVRASECPRTLDVRSDAVTGLLLFFGNDREPLVIAKTTGLTPDAVDAWTFHDRLGAPRSWIVASTTATVFAWFALVLAFASQRRPDVIEAHHEGRGWVRISGVPRFVAELVGDAAGPVDIVSRDATRPATYRDDGGAKIFTVATRAPVASWTYVAVAAIVLASAPMWIARVYGLL
jgi:hypothetical protein